jgi:hypothetical protein
MVYLSPFHKSWLGLAAMPLAARAWKKNTAHSLACTPRTLKLHVHSRRSLTRRRSVCLLQEKRRREHDKAKAASAKDKAKAKEVTPANRLARQTAFQCTIQFRNDLPPVPVEPKLLPVPTSWARFVAYDACLSLDAERQHDLLLEPELSIPLDVLEVRPP